MKKIFILIILFGVFVGATQVNALSIPSLNNLFYYSVCNQPIKYRIDTVDPKFNLPKEQFSSDVNQAAQIWNNAISKDLFVYDPKGDLSIDLIYDERQSLTNQIQQLENNVKSDKQALNPKISEYQKKSLEFKRKVEDLNNEIKDWNSKGGAPPEEYERIIQIQQSLQTEADFLNALAESLNISSQEYNTEVNKLNQTISVFNNTLVERPEEGIYKGSENRIEIYFNITKTELIHTIAHELGHALGLEHVNSPKAIMYSKTNQSLSLTEEEKEILNDLCKKRSIFEVFQQLIVQTISRYNYKH